MSFDVFIRCNECGHLCEIRGNIVIAEGAAPEEPAPRYEPREGDIQPVLFEPPPLDPPPEEPKRKDGVFLRPPSDDVPTDDAELMRQATEGRWGPRLARAIQIGGLGIDKVRLAVEQMTRPGRSQPEAPSSDDSA